MKVVPDWRYSQELIDEFTNAICQCGYKRREHTPVGTFKPTGVDMTVRFVCPQNSNRTFKYSVTLNV